MPSSIHLDLDLKRRWWCGGRGVVALGNMRNGIWRSCCVGGERLVASGREEALVSSDKEEVSPRYAKEEEDKA